MKTESTSDWEEEQANAPSTAISSHLGNWAQVAAQRACRVQQKGLAPPGLIRGDACHYCERDR